MKKLKSRSALIFSTFAIVAGLAAVGYGQKVGGYKEISKSDASARSAAIFAVGAEAEKNSATIELDSVLQAEQQVVAGMNYRMCLKVTTSGAKDEANVTITVRVVVYRDLKGNYKLTSWKEEACGEDEDEN